MEEETLEVQIAESLDEVDDEVVEIVGNTLYFLMPEERQCSALSFFCYFLLIFDFI